SGAMQSVNGSNVLNGTVTLVTPDASIGVSSGTTLTLAGFAQGAGGLTKVGLGTLTLLANNNYSLGTTVNGGTLLVNGTQAQSTAVNANAKLGGSGAVGAVTSTGGTISPGQSPGILSTGNLSLNASST